MYHLEHAVSDAEAPVTYYENAKKNAVAIVMKIDIYYRFIGRVGDTEGKDLRAAHVRRNNKLLVEAGVIPAETAKSI